MFFENEWKIVGRVAHTPHTHTSEKRAGRVRGFNTSLRKSTNWFYAFYRFTSFARTHPLYSAGTVPPRASVKVLMRTGLRNVRTGGPEDFDEIFSSLCSLMFRKHISNTQSRNVRGHFATTVFPLGISDVSQKVLRTRRSAGYFVFFVK